MRLYKVTTIDGEAPGTFYGYLYSVNNGGSATDGLQFTFRTEGGGVRHIFESELGSMERVDSEDHTPVSRRPVRRCEAFARQGTGYGTCNEPLDAYGQCLYASTHVTD